MPFGVSGIPELRLEVLQRLIERFVMPPNLILMKMFGEMRAESDTILWESAIGTRGMSPFAAPGTPAPRISVEGVARNEAQSAYWKEKIWFDESFLNNLREPGTREQHQNAQTQLTKATQKLKNRSDRRKEWMFAKMLTGGGFTYLGKNGVRLSVDYGIPAENKVTLATDRKWDTGTAKNILEDIMDVQLAMSNANGAVINNAVFTSEILKLMVMNSGVQTLLEKSAFGNGDLFARPLEVVGSLLNIKNMILYDEQYQIRAWLTGNVTGTSTTVIPVDDPTDFEVGGTLRFFNVAARTYEDETIASIQHDAGTVTVATAPTASFRAGRDYVAMTKKFIPNDKFIMFADTVEGEKIAEYMSAPYGLGRQYGAQVDQKEEWDPDGVFIRIQDKGLPVLYQEDALYILTVK